MRNLIFGAGLTVALCATALAQDGPVIQIDQLAKTSTSWDGTELPAYGDGKPEITVIRATIPPGGEFPNHKHPTINAGVLLSGSLTVMTEDGDTLSLGAGDALIEVVEQWHYGKNNGKVPAEIVVFYAGTVGQPITISTPERDVEEANREAKK
ncbi:MAG: cupin domain-containing protein [Rhodothermia bacterium]